VLFSSKGAPLPRPPLPQEPAFDRACCVGDGDGKDTNDVLASYSMEGHQDSMEISMVIRSSELVLGESELYCFVSCEIIACSVLFCFWLHLGSGSRSQG